VTVTAVVLSYWPARFPNVSTIVRDLHTATMPPDKTLVVLQGHNAMAHIRETDDWWFDGRVEVVRTPANFRTRAKFVAALLHLADWYLLMDDDTSVNPLTVEHLVGYDKTSMTEDILVDDWCTGYWGVTLAGRSFMGGTIHQPNHLLAPMRVDGFHGRVIFCNHASLSRMFGGELYLRSDYEGNIVFPHEGDDIILGLDGNGWLVPMRGDEWFKDLDQYGQALQFDTEAVEGEEHYYALRDRFTAHVLDRLKR
jgi:hypothetical protein